MTAASLFIGLDLTDPFAKRKRPSDRALLDADLVCRFDRWRYDDDVESRSIVPAAAEGAPFVLAIDGPQGLAATPDRPTRVCDHVLTAAGKCPYELPVIDPKPYKPYAGFVRGSVLLFYQLAMSGHFRLLGLTPNPNLIEVYPGAAWRTLKSGWFKKTTLDGRRERLALLQGRGLRFPTDAVPTHDQLDAALAAYIAYLYAAGDTDCCGEPPSVADGVLREGYIVQPCPKVVMQ